MGASKHSHVLIIGNDYYGCERREARQLYTIETDPLLIFFPIVYSPEELTEAAAHLLALIRR
jgi:hypothetical protein